MSRLQQRAAAFRAGHAFYVARATYLHARIGSGDAEPVTQEVFGAALQYELALQPLDAPWARDMRTQLRNFLNSLSCEYNYTTSRGRATQKILPPREA